MHFRYNIITTSPILFSSERYVEHAVYYMHVHVFEHMVPEVLFFMLIDCCICTLTLMVNIQSNVQRDEIRRGEVI